LNRGQTPPAARLTTPRLVPCAAQFKAAFVQTRRTSAGMQGQLAAMGRFNSTKQLAELACPTLVTCGDRDAVMPPRNSESLARRIPGARLRTWDGAGHFFWAHRTAEVCGELSQFLESSDEARAASRAFRPLLAGTFFASSVVLASKVMCRSPSTADVQLVETDAPKVVGDSKVGDSKVIEVEVKADDVTEAGTEGDATEGGSSSAAAESAKAKEKGPEPVSLAALFRYADAKDAMLLAVATIAIMISGANQPLQLVVFGRLLDSFNDLDLDEAVEKINFFAACYAILGAQQMVTQSLQSACLSASAARQTRRIRSLYFSSLARQPMSQADASDCGALASGVLEATTVMAAGMGDELAKVAQTLLQFAIGLTVALVLSWRLALVSATGIPVLGFIVAVANKAYARSTRDASSALGAASSSALEAIAGVRTLNAYGREPHVIESFGGNLLAACKQGIRMGRARAALEGTMAPIMFLLFGFGLWYGSSLVATDMEDNEKCRFATAEGEPQFPDATQCLTGGNVMTAFLSVLFGFMGLLQMLPGITALAAARTAAAKVYTTLDAPPSTIDALSTAGEAPAARAAGRIELRDVHFAYPSRMELPVYQGLNLTIEAGQTVALAGPSGCGKSTVVSLLERFYDADAGAVLLDGVDVKQLNVRWLRAQIGLVSQEPVLFAGTIGWNISMGRDGATQEEVEAAATLSNAAGFVASFPEQYATEVTLTRALTRALKPHPNPSPAPKASRLSPGPSP